MLTWLAAIAMVSLWTLTWVWKTITILCFRGRSEITRTNEIGKTASLPSHHASRCRPVGVQMCELLMSRTETTLTSDQCTDDPRPTGEIQDHSQIAVPL